MAERPWYFRISRRVDDFFWGYPTPVRNWLGGEQPCPTCKRVHTCTLGHHGCGNLEHYDCQDEEESEESEEKPRPPTCPRCHKRHKCSSGHFDCRAVRHYKPDCCPVKKSTYNRIRSAPKHIDQSGGTFYVDGAKVEFASGATPRRRKYQLEVEHAPKEKTPVGDGEEKFLIGDSISILSSAADGFDNDGRRCDHEGDGDSSCDGEQSFAQAQQKSIVTMYSDFPDGIEEDPVLFRSDTANRREPTNVRDDTRNARLKADRQNCSIQFCISGKIDNVIFWLLWRFKKSHKALRSMITYMANYQKQFYVRLHYRCELGYPSEVMLAIGSDEPPRPDGNVEITDGIYTAECTKGKQNCTGVYVTRRSKVSIEVKADGCETRNVCNTDERPLQYFFDVESEYEKRKQRRTHLSKHPCISIPRRLEKSHSSGEVCYNFELHIQHNGIYEGPSRLKICRQQPELVDLNANGQHIQVLNDMPSDARLCQFSHILNRLDAGPGLLLEVLNLQCSQDNTRSPNQVPISTEEIMAKLRAWSIANPEECNRQLLFKKFRERCSNDQLLGHVAKVFKETNCPPSVPGVTIIYTGKTSTCVKIMPPKDFGGYREVTYMLAYKLLSGVQSEPYIELSVKDAAREVRIPKLLPGRHYKVLARATNNAGSTDSSPVLVETQRSAPSAPHVILESTSTTSASVEIIPSSDAGGCPLVTYTLFWQLSDTSTSDDWSSLQVKDVEQVQTISPLASFQSYKVFVMAENDAGSETSYTVIATTYEAGFAEIPPDALMELADRISSKAECARLAAQLGFEEHAIMKWIGSVESTDSIAQDILLKWKAKTNGTPKGTRTALGNALKRIGRRNLYNFFLEEYNKRKM